jgi:hypothetical protein
MMVVPRAVRLTGVTQPLGLYHPYPLLPFPSTVAAANKCCRRAALPTLDACYGCGEGAADDDKRGVTHFRRVDAKVDGGTCEAQRRKRSELVTCDAGP